MISAKVIADSVATDSVARLTTLEVVMPRIVLAEFNTHRMFSRNSASSRAIPVEKRIEQIRANPFVPEAFGRNQRGMQAGEDLADQDEARGVWLDAMDDALGRAASLAKLGVHKQWANRLLEPFSWHTVVVSSTTWSNFFALRCHPDAQPEMRRVAEAMRDALAASDPVQKFAGDWHLPYTSPDDDVNDGIIHPDNLSHPSYLVLSPEDRVQFVRVQTSVARCAAVSYERQGVQDVAAEVSRYWKLRTSGHLSPFEHAAQLNSPAQYHGNFWGWRQHRKDIPGESQFAILQHSERRGAT